MLIVKALAVWVGMVVAAIANGLLREQLLNDSLGEAAALPLSGVLLALLIALIVYASIGWFAGRGRIFYIALGLFWVALTLAFEYGLGFFVMGKSLGEIHQVFDVRGGNLFALVMLVTLLGPVVAARVKGVMR